MAIQEKMPPALAGAEQPTDGEGERKISIIAEQISQPERAKYFLTVSNPFHRERPRTEAEQLSFGHPRVVEFEEGKRDFRPSDLVTVRYIDRKGREVEDQWRLDEYLKRIGFSGDYSQGLKPFDRFKKLAQSGSDLAAEMLKTHLGAVQTRIKRGHDFDQKLQDQARDSQAGKISRQRQLRSQYEEDPFFVHTLEGSSYIYPMELNIHHDYLDAIDVLVEIDISDFEEDWQEEPVYLGVQRTLLEQNRDRLAMKEEKIKKAPLWYLPEYPERNPVLRVLYREDPDEYYLADGVSRWDEIKELTREENRKNPRRAEERGAKLLRADKVIPGGEKKMIGKTLDVLYQALDNVTEYHNDRNRPVHLRKTYAKYGRALRKIIAIIEEDTGLSRNKIGQL